MRSAPLMMAIAFALAVTPPALSGCGAAATASSPAHAIPANARTTSLSLFDVDCAECADKVVVELRKEGTIYETAFDKKRVVLRVVADPAVSDSKLLDAVKRAGFRAELGDKGGAYERDADAPPGADVSTPVTDGHDVAMESVLAAAKITVVDFYADWCGPCREVDRHVKSLLASRTDIAYRRLNVVDWDTPLAAHYMKKIPSLPYVIVFGADGRQVDAISGFDLGRLDAAIAKARR